MPADVYDEKDEWKDDGLTTPIHKALALALPLPIEQ